MITRTTILAEKCESLDIELNLKKIQSTQEELNQSEFIKSFFELEAIKKCSFKELYSFGLGKFLLFNTKFYFKDEIIMTMV